MTFKPPMDFKDLMKMFEPDQISKMFAPEQMKSAFEGAWNSPFDLESLISENQKKSEAMVAANQAAAASYQEYYKKQMAIFAEITNGAQEKLKSGSTEGKDAAETYQQAVQTALELMAEFATATQAAQTEVAAMIDSQVKEAMAGFKAD